MGGGIWGGSWLCRVLFFQRRWGPGLTGTATTTRYRTVPEPRCRCQIIISKIQNGQYGQYKLKIGQHILARPVNYKKVPIQFQTVPYRRCGTGFNEYDRVVIETVVTKSVKKSGNGTGTVVLSTEINIQAQFHVILLSFSSHHGQYILDPHEASDLLLLLFG